MLWRASQLLLSSEIRASEVGLPEREVGPSLSCEPGPGCEKYAMVGASWLWPRLSVVRLPKHVSPGSGGVTGRATAFTHQKKPIQAISNTSRGHGGLWGPLRKNSLFFRAIFPLRVLRFVNLLCNIQTPKTSIPLQFAIHKLRIHNIIIIVKLSYLPVSSKT